MWSVLAGQVLGQMVLLNTAFNMGVVVVVMPIPGGARGGTS